MPAAKPLYGVLNGALANELSDEAARTLIALLILVTGLAAATIWFVALPLLDNPRRETQACDMFVLTKSGVTRCIPETPPGTPIPGAET